MSVETKKQSSAETEAPAYLRATIIVAICMVAGAGLEWIPDEPSPWRWLPLGLAYLAGGGPILRDTLVTLREGRLSIDFLMGFAALGAAGVGQPLEGVILIFLFSLSNTLEAHALGRTRREIEALMDLHPEEATLLDEAGAELGRTPSGSLSPGQKILVRPGERIAADGQVVDGRSEVDQSAITGESAPVTRTQGDEVFAGTINKGGTLTVKVTRPAGETMLARIVRMVEEARSEQTPAQDFIDRFAHPYTLVVLGGSLATALVAATFLDMSMGDAVYRAMTVVVVASPCALVISTPAAVLSALANGARNGVLYKGGGVLERAGALDAMAFDKTGTLTIGEPVLLATFNVSEEAVAVTPGNGPPTGASVNLLELAASVEAVSEHHLAGALLRAAQAAGITPRPVRDFLSTPGEGVEGVLDGQAVWVGNGKMAERRGAAVPRSVEQWMLQQADQGRSVVLAGKGTSVLGSFAFGDLLRPGAGDALRRLRSEGGIRSIVILSGDHPKAVASIAADLGADEVHAGLLPDQKVVVLRELAARSAAVGMVGDGVNDAPAMAAASVGIAMGAAGTDVAIETADIVLMSDEIDKIPYLVTLGKRTTRIVRQNVWFSVGWMALLVVAATTVGLPLTLAVVAHEGSTLLVVLNGLRLLRGG